MSELLNNALTSLGSEDFDAMMGDEFGPELKMPYGLDVMLVLPEDQVQSDHVCNVATGTGDDEDEALPRYDPGIEGSVEDLN